MANVINPSMLNALRVDLEAALEGVAKKYGITLTTGRATYSANHFSMKLDGIPVGALTPEEEHYDQMSRFLGLPPRGTEFQFRRITYKTFGMNARGTKVTCTRVEDGKHFLIAPEDVKQSTGGASSAVKLTRVEAP